MSVTPYPFGETVAAKISTYLETGMHHSTPEGQRIISDIIARELPYQLRSLIHEVCAELRSQIELPEDQHAVFAKRRCARRLLEKLESLFDHA